MKEKSQYRSHLIQKEFAGTYKLLVWVKKKKKKRFLRVILTRIEKN